MNQYPLRRPNACIGSAAHPSLYSGPTYKAPAVGAASKNMMNHYCGPRRREPFIQLKYMIFFDFQRQILSTGDKTTSFA
jgi:hypothetical protein